ncbi:hypothetical protein [Egicoccus sp. AB-alg2]|uniref:hypothetical protein n=1 Tax=Egicoccus sp. AB-alg2 TaxID=3242693 RepID=UPI00359F05D8
MTTTPDAADSSSPSPDKADPLTPEQHLHLAVALFNRAWELLETPGRGPDADDEMLHTAHASRLHWAAAGGDAMRLATGEWQCSRVYAELGRAEPATWHARRTLAICLANGLGGFLEGAAHEAVARAGLLAGDLDTVRVHLGQARAIAAEVEDDEDRAILESDLDELDVEVARRDTD